MVRVELARIMISDNQAQQVIWLKEKGGSRSFPILIGPFEAMAIRNRILGNRPERPLTHDLITDLIRQLGGTVKRLEVSKLEDEVFFALLVVEQNGSTLSIDCRPSDGIAISVRCEIPIFVADEVMNKVATEPTIET